MAAAAPLTAAAYLKRLRALQSDVEREKIQRYFKTGAGEYGAGDRFLGVRMGQLFALSREFGAMSPAEIEKLLDSPWHEGRAGGCSIMDKQGRSARTPESRRMELYDLYLRRHDRINNWDLVDLAAPFVVGRYLFDKARRPLDRLARSKNVWERRTAIVSTSYFLRQGEVEETFRIAELLIKDREDMIHKPLGGWIRHAGGKTGSPRLKEFLDKHAATMPRVALRYAIEHLTPARRAHYLGLAKATQD